MPTSPYVKKLVKETGEKESDIEEKWNKAKKITEETFGVDESEFSEREFEYSKEVVYRMMGLDEQWNIGEFMKSDMSAREFIESAVQTSGDFNTPKGGIVNKDDEDDDEESVRLYKQDSTGPHGQGAGPGKGKADGTGIKKESVENDPDEDVFSGKVPYDPEKVEE
jgi:hypothetical protein